MIINHFICQDKELSDFFLWISYPSYKMEILVLHRDVVGQTE